MKSLSINLLRWNSGWDEIRACIEAVLASDLVDFELTYMENFNPDCPSLASEVKEQFEADGRVRVVVMEANLGYAGGHNRFFDETGSELLMVLNPDALIEPDFLKRIVAAFEDPHVGAATGKMIKPGQNSSGERTLDGTGILVSRSRRGYERGQLEIDRGQYDNEPQVFGVSGTAAVYRKSALEAVKI
jgi:GT2 family glycosyltransferase